MKQDKLTDRDKRLLETLSDFGLMSTDQLERKIFSPIRNTTALRRLRKLEKRKLLSRSSGLAKGRLAWSITAKGGSVVGLPEGFGHINRNTLEHDVLVNELRLILEEIGASRGWKSGHSLKREVSPQRGEGGLLPDGILFLPSGDSVKAVGIELELSAKALGRYRSVLEEYDDKKSIALVWYIVSHPSIAKIVMKALDSKGSFERKGDWVYWTPLSEFLGDPFQIKLRSKNKTLWLKDLVPIQLIPKPSNSPAQGRAHEVSTRGETSENIDHAKPTDVKEKSRSPPNPDFAFQP
jgi:hypothetical protein